MADWRGPLGIASYVVGGLLAAAMTLHAQGGLTSTAGTGVQATASASEQRTAAHLNRIRRDPGALRAFLRAMPKGADLHSHLTGAVYAESYIRWAADLPLCIDVTTFTYVEGVSGQLGGAGAAPTTTCAGPRQQPAARALQDPVLYRNVIDALSTRNWVARGAVGHHQFFDTFRRFDAILDKGGDVSTTILGRAVAEVAHRAALQNVQHLELMQTFGPEAGVESADESWDSDEGFPLLRERLLAGGLRGRVAERRRWLDAVDVEARAALGCATPRAMPGCDISVRFVPNVLRARPPAQVFAQTLFAFELAATDPRIAGVNLVMPEDWFVPMRDYDLHMRMFRFFRASYPDVQVALHAGELSLGLVPPEKLGLHIRQAIEVGGARRIGHGTDIMYDTDPEGLMREMVRRRIAVEISLSSSDVILGVRGPHHPLREYLRAGVPVVIVTDDEGVSRSDLTNELQRAVEEHGVSYGQLKRMSRNSIEHSFLPADAKGRLRQQLEAAFTTFEARYR